MNGKHRVWAIVLAVLVGQYSFAGIDLVTLPEQDRVQLSIYNSADLTLVRDQRRLTMKQGLNRLQFSWANTLIDPTSLELTPQSEGIEVSVLDFPPRTRQLGIWSVESETSRTAPMEITYLTSGLSWRAFYMGTLSPDESHILLQAYVRVQNNSGEDYLNAQTRLIVGQIHLIDQIVELANQQYPYGRPQDFSLVGGLVGFSKSSEVDEDMLFERGGFGDYSQKHEIKKIMKEGLSEYVLYTIEGTENLKNQWAKRLPSFPPAEVPVMNLYKCTQGDIRGRDGDDGWGTPTVFRYLSFTNDTGHALGVTPLPEGGFQVFREVDGGNLSYEGASYMQYIPVGEKAELNLGMVEDVIVEPKLMGLRTDSYLFDSNGDIVGWDEIRTVKVRLRNTRRLPVKIEYTRDLATAHWSLRQLSPQVEKVYEQVDLDTFRYMLDLHPETVEEISYELTIRHGRRAE